MRLSQIPAISRSVVLDNPWGIDTLTLRIYASDRDEYVRAVGETLVDKQATQKALAETIGASEKLSDKKKSERLASASKRELSKMLDEHIEGKHLEPASRHLFEIVECNLYGEEVADKTQNRFRLLRPLYAPPEGFFGVFYEPKDAKECPLVCLPSRVPGGACEDGKIMAQWMEHLAQGLGEGDWKGQSVEALPFAKKDDPSWVPVHELIWRWILHESQERGQALGKAQKDAEDFLAPTPSTSDTP